MINKMKRYFESLPISFGHALMAMMVVAILIGLKSYLLVSAKSTLVDPKEMERIVFIFPVLNYGVWLLLLPLLFKYLKRVNDGSLDSLQRNFSVVILSIGFTLGHELIGLLIYNSGNYLLFLFSFIDTFGIDIWAGILGLSKTYVEFWVIYFLLFHFHEKKKFRQAEIRNFQLEANLVKAQMSALKNQLHPHFLFNTFNTISALMEEDIPLAQRMIAKLGLLLRKILKDGDVQFLALEEEVEMAKLYLEVEQIRFKGRLLTRFAIEPPVRRIPVPTLILQPAVENAIKHGFYNKTGSCEISIQAYEEADFVCIEIADNGKGGKKNSNVSFGMGLTNMRHRLTTSYGEGYELNVNSKSAKSGFIVQIKIRKEAAKNENISSLSG